MLERAEEVHGAHLVDVLVRRRGDVPKGDEPRLEFDPLGLVGRGPPVFTVANALDHPGQDRGAKAIVLKHG